MTDIREQFGALVKQNQKDLTEARSRFVARLEHQLKETFGEGFNVAPATITQMIEEAERKVFKELDELFSGPSDGHTAD